MKYRTGRRNPRTIYLQINDQPSDSVDYQVGTMDTIELARLAVAGMNAQGPATLTIPAVTESAEPGHQDLSIPPYCQDERGNECEPVDCALTVPHYIRHPKVPR